jgi:hypothetical protein
VKKVVMGLVFLAVLAAPIATSAGGEDSPAPLGPGPVAEGDTGPGGYALIFETPRRAPADQETLLPGEEPLPLSASTDADVANGPNGAGGYTLFGTPGRQSTSGNHRRRDFIVCYGRGLQPNRGGNAISFAGVQSCPADSRVIYQQVQACLEKENYGGNIVLLKCSDIKDVRHGGSVGVSASKFCGAGGGDRRYRTFFHGGATVEGQGIQTGQDRSGWETIGLNCGD